MLEQRHGTCPVTDYGPSFSDFCVAALEDAIGSHGVPEILNTDQGSQFTSHEFTKVLKDADIKISMDGKGAWTNNVFIFPNSCRFHFM